METTSPASLPVRRWYLYILVALLVRGLGIFIQIHEVRDPDAPGSLYIRTGDIPSYVDPVENLIAHGHYAPDYRMPGVGAPYFLFRQFLEPEQSKDAYVLLQWLMSALAVYCLARLALAFTGSTRLFHAVFVVFLLSSYTNWYDTVVGTDSMGTSALIIHLFLLHRGMASGRPVYFIGAGLFLTWGIFLRPVLAPMLLLMLGLLWLHLKGRTRWMALAAFLLPVVVIDGTWTVRNYVEHGRLRPLTNDGQWAEWFTREARYSIMTFIQAYGGNYIWWDAGADIRWYGIVSQRPELDDHGRAAKEPPAYAYASTYDRDSLAWVAGHTRMLYEGELSAADSAALNAEIMQRMERYKAAYASEQFFQHQVMARLRMLRHFLGQHGTETLMGRPYEALPLAGKLFKLSQMVLFRSVLVLGLLGLFFVRGMTRHGERFTVWAITLTMVYLVFIHPFGLRLLEWRYFVPAFPLVLLMGVTCACHLGGLARRRLGWVRPLEPAKA